jgi:RNA polymerase sigma-70 factor (ECF subfamily)
MQNQGRPSFQRNQIAYNTLVDAVSLHPKAKREEACGMIYDRVYRVVAVILRPDAPDVGDVTQEAFMRVYSAIPDFTPERPESPTAWINKISARVAIDWRRVLLRRNKIETDEDDRTAPEPEPSIPDPDTTILVTTLLDQLDEGDRAILVLKHWNGNTVEEIAEDLGMPTGTVKTRTRIAERKLRASLHDTSSMKHFVADAEERDA